MQYKAKPASGKDTVMDCHLLKNFNSSLLVEILEHSYDGIYITDAEGLTLYVNKSYERMTGRSREDYIGKYMQDLMDSGIMKTYITKDVVRLKKSITITEPLVNGKEVIITGNPVFDENNEVVMVVTNLRDITELILLEKEYELTQETSLRYQQELFSSVNPDNIICKSPVTKQAFLTASRIACRDSTVLILGETGVGKDVFARYIHTKSSRSTGPYIKINCGSIPHNLLESELFGYVGGAFTGANSKGKPGMFELANGGTLFLDEIGELPLDLQASLLRVLQDCEINRIGDTKSRRVDIRIIAATNRNLEQMIEQGTFRRDLYYRLNVLSIFIPPLRERQEDIAALAECIIQKLNDKYGEEKVISQKFIKELQAKPWLGNVRELSNFIEKQFIISDGNILEHFASDAARQSGYEYLSVIGIPPINEAVNKLESILLERAMKESGSTVKAAELLKISQPTFSRKYTRYCKTSRQK